jgi:hypothetical protein
VLNYSPVTPNQNVSVSHGKASDYTSCHSYQVSCHFATVAFSLTISDFFSAENRGFFVQQAGADSRRPIFRTADGGLNCPTLAQIVMALCMKTHSKKWLAFSQERSCGSLSR